MRYNCRDSWIDDDYDADFNIRIKEAPSAAGDLLATSPALVSFVILAITIIVDAILGFVSILFAATIFLIFVSFVLWLICGGITILFCGTGAIISLIGMLCSLRRPPALAANFASFFANGTMVGLAVWLMSELLDKFR